MMALTFFLLIFFFDGMGFFSEKGRVVLVLISFLPVLYYLEQLILKKSVAIPKKILIFLSLLLFFLTVSFYFSVDKINSFFHLIFYLSLFFVFIIGFNEKKLVALYLKPLFIFLGSVFSLTSLVIVNKPPQSALQFVYPLYANHNHLGDFLGLVIVFLIFDFFKKKEKINLYFILFFFPFFLFSWSRTAFVGLTIILLFILIFKQKRNPLLPIGLIAVTLIFFIISQKEFYQITKLNFVNNFLLQKLSFTPRSFISGRDEYFTQAIKGFLEKPIFGWGPGNFIYPSEKYVTTNLQQVSSSLNIFLTLLTEGGVFVFLIFISFILLIIFSFLKNHKKIEEESYFFSFLYLLFNFSFDYTYAIKTFFLLWFLLAGMIYQEKKKANNNWFIFFANLGLLTVVIYLTSQIFLLTGQLGKSITIFPYQHQGYQLLIKKLLDKGDVRQAKLIAKKYLQQTSFYSYETGQFLSDFFIKINDDKQAIEGLRFYLKNNRFPSFELAKKYYLLSKKNNLKNEADKEFEKIFTNLKTTFWFNQAFADEVYQFCFNENIPGCRFRRFYIPQGNSQEKTDKSLPYQAVYTLNNDGLNERFNYSRKKPKGVFRIAVLGGGEAFGFLVNTKDNWVERVEDNLKVNNQLKKYEVLNFAYHSYDLGYQVQRFLIQVKEYQPDLIIWLNNDFYRLNEIFLPITEEKEALIRLNKEKEKYQKQGRYFPSWQLAMKEYEKKVKKLGIDIEQKQIEYLNEVFSSYNGPIIFISFSNPPEKIKTVLEENTCYLYYPQFTQPEYQFEKTGGLNYLGNQKLANEISFFIVNNDLSLCLKKKSFQRGGLMGLLINE